MSEQSQTLKRRKVILMGPYEADMFLIMERERSLRRQKAEDMSRKEKSEALGCLMDIVGRHEGTWNVNRIVAEVVVRMGQRRETVEGYLGDLQRAGLVTVRGEHVYTVDREGKEKEEEKKEQ